MLTSIASAAGWAYTTGMEVSAGSTYSKETVPTETLAGWVRQGIAEPIPEIRIEAATQLEPETASVATPRRGRTRGR